MRNRRMWAPLAWLAAVVLGLTVLAGCNRASNTPHEVTVWADPSFTEPLPQAADTFRQTRTGTSVRFRFAAPDDIVAAVAKGEAASMVITERAAVTRLRQEGHTSGAVWQVATRGDVVYEAVMIAGTLDVGAGQDFLKYMASPQGQSPLRAAGFGPPAAAG